MPDQVHNAEKDFVYFVLEDFFVIGCYQQIPSSKIKEKSQDVTRATIQKSLCYFTKNFNYSPLGLSYIRARIQDFFHAYFEQAQLGSFANKAILESLHKDMPQIIATATSQIADIPDHKYLKSSPVLRLLSRFGRTVLSLLKLMLLEKRVVIYGMPVGETSDLVVALCSLLPLFNEKRGSIAFIPEGGVYEAPALPSIGMNRSKSQAFVVPAIEYGSSEQEFAKLRLPLRVASYSFISGQVVLTQADWLNSMPSYFVATSNALLPMHRHVLELDVSFDATTARLVTHAPQLDQALKLTPEDAAFMDFIVSKVQTDEHSDPFADFVVVDEECPTGAAFTPGTTAAWQYKESWVRTMFAGYIKALLASVSAHVNGEVAASRFNAHFLALWCETRNFHAWQAQIDVRALHADPTYNDLNHPGLTLPHTPNTFVGKSLQTVKGSLSSVKDTVTGSLSSLGASNFVSAINSAWNTRSPSPSSQSTPPPGTWGLDAHFASAQSSTKPITTTETPTSPAQPSSPAPAAPTTTSPASSSSTPSRTPSFFESMKQKLSSPFGRSERAERTAAQFEQMPLDGAAPTVIQPAQLAHKTPNNPATDTKPTDSDEDLLGF